MAKEKIILGNNEIHALLVNGLCQTESGTMITFDEEVTNTFLQRALGDRLEKQPEKKKRKYQQIFVEELHYERRENEKKQKSFYEYAIFEDGGPPHIAIKVDGDIEIYPLFNIMFPEQHEEQKKELAIWKSEHPENFR